jgi:uncharacterized protein (DUF608 family)
MILVLKNGGTVMKKNRLMVSTPLLLALICYNIFGKVGGSSGLPLGGIGTGAIKFNAASGTFSANFRTPTRNGDYQLLTDTHFQIFAQRGGNIQTAEILTAVVVGDSVQDDAVFPRHYVNFGEWNGVSVEMTAYLPYAPGSINLMCHPAALYEFTVSNTLSSNAMVSVAFKITTPVVPLAITDSGFVANSANLELCLLGTGYQSVADLSYGNDSGFFNTGLCNNVLSGTTNRLALRVSLAALESKKIRFVLAWYQWADQGHYRYSTIWNNAQAVAVSALDNFDLFKDKAEELVNRMHGSNLPFWLTDQALNSLVNLVNNSVFFQDGRYCHTEGMWSPEGTMDQMWHARQVYTMINPDLAWQELEWWARTQHVQNYTGQIHHDFGTDFNYVDWDNSEHSDYRSIYEWVDLNCGFIISVYEAFIATADQDKLNYFWPYVKLAAQRILNQVQAYGSSQYPYTFDNSLSTYDAGGNSQAYNTGLSVATYQIVKYLAGVMGETATANVYQNALQTAVTGFENRYLDNPYPVGNFCESALGGPWIANFLKLGPFWPKQKLDNLFITISTYYDPLNKGMGYTGGSYSEWQPYLISHLGGYALQTGRTSIWSSLQYDMYERSYDNRNLVFNEQLGIPAKVTSPIWIATSVAGSDQYISIPVVWRNYYDLTGFHYNKYSGELWLEPKYTDATSHQLQNALVIMPGNYATINYTAYGESYQNQNISFAPDQTMEVTAIYIRDLYADSAQSISAVRVNGIETDYLRMGSGDQARLWLNWSGTIPVGGVTIEAEGKARPGAMIPLAPQNFQGSVIGPSQILLQWKPAGGDIYGYYIETGLGGNFQRVATAAANDTAYLETGLLSSHEYTYRIRSFNSQNISDPGPEIKVTTEASGNGEVLLAINAGGANYLSGQGIQYIADATSGYVSGGSTYSTTDTIANTDDDQLYQSERYGDFAYSIPLANGVYNVVLKFAEIYQDTPGARIFRVNIEGQQVINNLDLYLRTGKDRAYDVVIPVDLTDGTLNINFITVMDNAKLSALEIRNRIMNSATDPEKSGLPLVFALDQNYPNPFNSKTTITYALARESWVQVEIINMLGQKIKTLVQEKMPAGWHRVQFDAADLGSGVYIYRLKAGDFVQAKKMILIK